MQGARIILFFISIVFLMSSVAYAHQPVIVKDQSSREKPVMVKEPEISYAYYGELAGESHYYRIVYPKPFILYVNILVPDFSPKTEPINTHDMSFQIMADEEILFTTAGEESEWKRFYEKYGRDHYYMGPEFERSVSAGTYHVKVFNKKNIGKYALAIGKKERFTPWGLIGALRKARSLDKWFFKQNSGGGNMESSQKKLIDFSEPDEKENWRVVNDGVMGGISQSQITISEDDTAVFQGTVSLENYGGFASVRTQPKNYQLAGYDGIAIRVKGDGKKYQLRLRTDDQFDGVSYQAEFETVPGKWITLNLPFKPFVPTFRGRIVTDAPALNSERIRQIGFLIADKQEGAFRLEVDWIGAYME